MDGNFEYESELSIVLKDLAVVSYPMSKKELAEELKREREELEERLFLVNCLLDGIKKEEK